jgi:hypothetical protein
MTSLQEESGGQIFILDETQNVWLVDFVYCVHCVDWVIVSKSESIIESMEFIASFESVKFIALIVLFAFFEFVRLFVPES